LHPEKETAVTTARMERDIIARVLISVKSLS